MIHRAHRRPPTIPARRGMRSSWFRGRYAGEPVDDPGVPADDPAVPGDDPAVAAERAREAVPRDPSTADHTPGAADHPSAAVLRHPSAGADVIEPARLADTGPASLLRPVHGHPTF